MAPLTQDEVLKKLEEYNKMPPGERKDIHPFKNVEIGDVDFKRFKFEGEVNFSEANFVGEANFSGAQFSEGTVFNNIQFIKKVSFSGAKFTKFAYFSGTQFNEDVYFHGCHFAGEATFFGVQFSKGVYFGIAQFKEKALFARVQFAREATFYGTQFAKEANFEGGQFLGKTIFGGHDEIKEEDVVIPENYIFKQNADFSNITLDPEKLSFKKVNLNKCFFIETDLAKIDFTGVQWGKKPIFLRIGKRDILYDEEEADRHSYPFVEKLYRQLKLNYERKGSYPEAGDFHFGEMEMKRKQLNWLRRHFFSFIVWYKYLSGYGEKYGLAFIWLILILFGFAIGYSFLDFEDIKEIKATFNLGRSLMYSLKIMTLQRYALNYEPMTELGRNLTAIQGILGPLQIALFALALRRRFKR